MLKAVRFRHRFESREKKNGPSDIAEHQRPLREPRLDSAPEGGAGGGGPPGPPRTRERGEHRPGDGSRRGHLDEPHQPFVPHSGPRTHGGADAPAPVLARIAGAAGGQRTPRLRTGDEQAAAGSRPAAVRDPHAAHGARHRSRTSAARRRDLRRPIHHEARPGGARAWASISSASRASWRATSTARASTPGRGRG